MMISHKMKFQKFAANDIPFEVVGYINPLYGLLMRTGVIQTHIYFLSYIVSYHQIPTNIRALCGEFSGSP